MRYSIASQALCGAITVSALAVPGTPIQKRDQLVDLTDFKGFPTLDPQEILNNADDAIREFFKQGKFNDGPLDKLGNFLDRPLTILDDIKDKIEDGLEDLDEKFRDHVQDQVQDLQDQIKGDFLGVHNQIKGEVQDATEDVKSPVSQPTSGTSQPTNGREQPANDGTKATAAGTCDPSNPNVRFEWAHYSNSDRTAFVQAIKCLQGKPSGGSQYTGSQNRYEDLVSVHRDMTANIHQTAAFLVWHRYFVWVFEQMLREECGFNRAMPWWDETKNAGNFAASDIFSGAWFGSLPAKTSNNQGTCIESGVCTALASSALHGSFSIADSCV
jgi:tyrosinase